jgi:hypothetical protein
MSLPMQKARYQGYATALSFGLSSNKNNQIAVTFEITQHDEHHGESITWIGHFTDKTAERTIESLQNAGWQGDDLSELEGLDEAGVRAALPEMVELVCEPEEYAPDNGRPEWILRVRWVNKPGGRFAFKEPLTGNELKAFAAQMRNTVRSVRGGGAHRSSNGSGERGGGSEPRSLPASGRVSAHPNAPGNRNDVPY